MLHGECHRKNSRANFESARNRRRCDCEFPERKFCRKILREKNFRGGGARYCGMPCCNRATARPINAIQQRVWMRRAIATVERNSPPSRSAKRRLNRKVAARRRRAKAREVVRPARAAQLADPTGQAAPDAGRSTDSRTLLGSRTVWRSSPGRIFDCYGPTTGANTKGNRKCPCDMSRRRRE